MRPRCTLWHASALVGGWLIALGAHAQPGPAAPIEAAPTEPAPTEPAPPPDATPDEAEPEAPADPAPERARTLASPIAPSAPSPPSASPPPPTHHEPPAARARYWRLPREGTRRPLTLPQGVMLWRSTVQTAVVPRPGGTAAFRASGFSAYAIGVLDDLELGTTPLGVTFLPPFTFHDPSVYVRGRVVSGEVQVALRAEAAFPLQSGGSVWLGAGVDLAWTPIDWFRLEAALEYGLLLSSPLHQTIHVPVRAMFQAGPNTFSVASGAIIYDAAYEVEVPLIFRWAVALRGYQGPLSEPALEGGIGHLGYPDRAWFVRGVWTFFAYP
ncbi:MAG: hypothetical protein KF729_29665 [Sandaracinaceae bacterium]|nr:hypothetical protein [Sandaracinaceae bacterium]